MAFPPQEPTDPFEAANSFGLTNSNVNQTPSAFGYGTRQSRLPNNRVAVDTRHVIHWLVPEGPIVQMYINPSNISIAYKKVLNPVRTKGGYVVQYWGEDLTAITLSGTTGTSGIEGINVLLDVYRNEQLAFDPYALYLQSQVTHETLVGNIFGEDSALTAGSNFVSALIGGAQSLIPSAAQNPPSLASLAFTVEMYHGGEVFRGFFENFTVTESADKIGLFDYNITFMSTQKRGFRQNFFAWHRSAVSGPSHTDPINGVPYSFSNLVQTNPNIPTR